MYIYIIYLCVASHFRYFLGDCKVSRAYFGSSALPTPWASRSAIRSINTRAFATSIQLAMLLEQKQHKIWCKFDVFFLLIWGGLVSNKSYTNIQISRFWCMVPGGVSTARTFGVFGIQRTPYWECLGIRRSGMSQNVWHLNSTCFSCRSIRFFLPGWSLHHTRIILQMTTGTPTIDGV